MNHHKQNEQIRDWSRRTFLSRSFAGIGSFALASLSANQLSGAENRDVPWPALKGLPHFAPKAKRIVHLCMAGGPSHVESLDPKPKLAEIDGQPFPKSMTDGQELAQLQNTELKARKAFCKFKKYGKAGIEISELFPEIGSIADDICVIRSMTTEQINHDTCLLYTSPSPRDRQKSRMPSSA